MRGAAEATALSQVVQAVVLARLAAKKLGTAGEASPLGTCGAAKDAAAVEKGGPSRPSPGRSSFLCFRSCLSFGVMTFTAARFGSVPLVAHQLTLTIFLLASLVLDAVAGQTAQAFLPPLKGRTGVQKLGRRLLKLSTGAALASSIAAGALALRGARLFSGDPAVASELAAVGGAARGERAPARRDRARRGRGLATADLKFVGASYAVSGVVFPALVGLAGPNARGRLMPSLCSRSRARRCCSFARGALAFFRRFRPSLRGRIGGGLLCGRRRGRRADASAGWPAMFARIPAIPTRTCSQMVVIFASVPLPAPAAAAVLGTIAMMLPKMVPRSSTTGIYSRICFLCLRRGLESAPGGARPGRPPPPVGDVASTTRRRGGFVDRGRFRRRAHVCVSKPRPRAAAVAASGRARALLESGQSSSESRFLAARIARSSARAQLASVSRDQ